MMAPAMLGPFLLCLGGDISPRGVECSLHHACLCRREMDESGAALAPDAVAGIEHVGRFSDKQALLLWRQLHHPPTLVRRGERRENLTLGTKIRVIHVF